MNKILSITALILLLTSCLSKPSEPLKDNLPREIISDSVIESVFSAESPSDLDCDYTCPEDEIWCLSNTYKMRVTRAGTIVYLWICDGDSSHNYWIK